MFTVLSGIVIASVCLALFVLGLTGVDDHLVALASRLRHRYRVIDFFFHTLSFTPLVVAALFLVPAVWLILRGQIVASLSVAITCCLALGFSFLGKFFIGRLRPLGHTTYIGYRDSAFPSAHTAGSFSAAFALAAIYPNYAPLLLALASAVALSRIYLQMHFLSDVAGGVLLAYVCAFFVTRSDFISYFLTLADAF